MCPCGTEPRQAHSRSCERYIGDKRILDERAETVSVLQHETELVHIV